MPELHVPQHAMPVSSVGFPTMRGGVRFGLRARKLAWTRS
jgi:hypothetical protein